MSYSGDLQKTNFLFYLCTAPLQERSEKWKADFLLNLLDASLTCGNPQTIIGSDGFPYFQLFLPKPGETFQCYTVRQLLNGLLQDGCGIVINPEKNPPDWILSCGDLMNFYLNQTFYSEKAQWLEIPPSFVIPSNTKMYFGDPAENILPSFTRHHIKNFLLQCGITTPQVLLIYYEMSDGLKASLSFNFGPENVGSQAQFENIMAAVQWYLPKHYTVTWYGKNDSSALNFFDL